MIKYLLNIMFMKLNNNITCNLSNFNKPEEVFESKVSQSAFSELYVLLNIYLLERIELKFKRKI